MIFNFDTPQKTYSRIISLVPSQTELLYYLGLDEEVIGITKFCVHPQKWFRNKTRVGGTKNLQIKTIQQLSPDLIIANKEENTKEQIEELAKEYNVFVTDVNNLDEALKMIDDIGALTGRLKSSSELVEKISEGFETLKKENFFKSKRRSAYFIWKSPWMVAGGNTFINDMMEYCGLENIFSDSPRYPSVSIGQIKERNPEIVLLSSEPYPFKKIHQQQIQELLPYSKVLLTDGEMFSWYGSRLLNSIEYFHTFINS